MCRKEMGPGKNAKKHPCEGMGTRVELMRVMCDSWDGREKGNK